MREKTREEEITLFLVALYKSEMSPSMQEYLTNNLHNLSDDDLSNLYDHLTKIVELKGCYQDAAHRYLEFHQRISKKIEMLLNTEATKIEREILSQLRLT